MALHGNLGDFALADVFRLVTLSGKTGVLRLERPDATGSVWFRGGEVFFATSDQASDLLGQRLVAAGRITPTQLAQALEIRAAEHEGGRRLGEIMIDHEMITFEVLEAFVQEQIQDGIFDLFLWDTGGFEFDLLQEAPEDQDIGLSVSVENIIMEASRRLSEWSKLRATAPGSTIVYRLSAAPSEGTVDISLTPSEWRVLVLTDGSRTVAQIAATARADELEVARTLHGLLGAGLLEVVGGEEPALEPEPASVSEPARAPEPVAEPEPEPARAPRPEPRPEPAPAPAPEPSPQPAPEPAPLSGRMSVPEPNLSNSGLWSGLGDEVTALTGSDEIRGRRESAATPGATTAAGDASRPVKIDDRVSRATIEAVLAGVERL